MAEARWTGGEITNPPSEDSNVRSLFGMAARPRREPPLTDAEISEYRRIKPLLQQLMVEWETLKSEKGCPVARSLLVK